MRIVGAGLIFSALSLLGMGFSSNLKAKEKRLYLMLKMLDDIIAMIRWSALTVTEISGRLYISGSYESLGFPGKLREKLEEGVSFPSAWKESVSGASVLDEDEKAKLIELGEILGSADVEGQLSSIGLIQSELMKMHDEQAEKYRTKGRLYRTVGVTVGAMAGIMII